MSTHRAAVVTVHVAVLCLLVAVAPAASAQETGRLDWGAIGDRGIELLREYIRIDTVNPPGNEIRGAEFFARELEAAGVEHEVLESQPGRGNIVARLRGDGSRGGAVVLLNHMDVVPADPAHWSVDPFAGTIRDGRLYGRGVADMKADAVVQLMTVLALHRADIPLGRDVVFMATAGEETGGFAGAAYIVEERPELIADVEFVLTEGGGGRDLGGRTVHLVETTQKMPLWLRLTASGPAGHGSTPLPHSAVDRLVRALDRIRTYRAGVRLVPPVADAIRATARLSPDPEWSRRLQRVEDNIGDPEFLEELQAQFGVLLRNTISITGLAGSPRTNVIPPVASAELDCRLLPGEDPELFIATLREVIDDPSVEIETILRFEAQSSPRDTALWRAIEEAAVRREPEA
ncbi:MAG: M20/M25/M40 family metallo-hydrolase, partial [Acidobacteriota bacterium]